MRKNIMNTVANMKVAEMRKVAGQYGIKNASKHRRPELEQMLIDAMVKEAEAEAAKKANKKSDKRTKAKKVESEQVTVLASGLVEQLKSDAVAVEELMSQNRKVLIVVMKTLHCKRWYRTYDKATMISKIAEAIVA